MSERMSELLPSWTWPDETCRVYEELRTYRIVGASACVAAIMRALRALALQPCGRDLAGTVYRRVAEVGACFCALKPNTAAYGNAVRWLLSGLDAGTDDHTVAAAISERVERYADYRRESVARIIDWARLLLPAGSHILIHDYSSTVLAVVDDAGKHGHILTVFVTAGEPVDQGPKVAQAVAQAGHRVVYLPDTGIGRVMGEIDIVLSGVETLFRQGDLANTVGTYPIALTAREANVPVYGVTERMKIHPTAPTTTVHELNAHVLHPWPRENQVLPAGTDVRDQILDLTPARLVTGYVTEDGILPPLDLSGALDRLFESLASTVS